MDRKILIPLVITAALLVGVGYWYNSSRGSQAICLQKPTTAQNPNTGEIQDFPNTCIPKGWVVVNRDGDTTRTVDDETAGWKTYSNTGYGLEFRHPIAYKSIDSQFASAKTTVADLWNSSQEAGIQIFVDEAIGTFNVQRIADRYAPTGLQGVPPQARVFGQNTFYYYGPGGGGVNYPDLFFYDLNGRTLVFTFDGHYSNSKTPDEATKQLEAQMLTTLKVTAAQSDATAGWKKYANPALGVEFKYPAGKVVDGGANAYFTHTLSFSGVTLGIFSDQSVSDWDSAITQAISQEKSVGDPAALPYKISVKNLLTAKSAGYRCTADFGEYLDKGLNESCEIVEINGIKAFKIVATGPFQSEVSELKYLFYENNTWFDASLRIWVYDQSNPSKQLYTFEQLNSILQGKISNPAIASQVNTFNKVVSTFKFTN